MTYHRRARFLCLLAATAASACSVFNRVDACDPQPATDFQVNTRTEDDQFPTANGGLAALPSGLVAAVWNTGSSTDIHQPSHVTVALMRPDGALVQPCGTPMVHEVTIDTAEDEIATHAVIAAGHQADTPIFVAWQARPAASDDDTGPFVIRARILSEHLCLVSDVFTLSDPADRISILPRLAVRASGYDAVALYVAETTGVQLAMRARRLGMGDGFVDGSVEAACTGAATTCTLDQGAALSDPAIAPLGDGYVVGWFAARADGQAGWQVRTHLLDSLGALADPAGWVPSGDAVLPDVEIANLALAPTTQPPGYALAWAAHNDDGRTGGDTDVFVERRGLDGALVMAPVRANSSTVGVRELPTMVELAGGALAVAWTDERADGRNVRGTILANGAPLFNGVACDAADFVLSSLGTGSRSVASLAQAQGGVLFAVFDDDSGSGTDAFGFAVRGHAFASARLAPALATAPR